MEQKQKVVIVVMDGLVQNVYCSDRQTEVSIIDCDTDDPAELDMVDNSFQDLRKSLERGELFGAY